MSLVVIIQPILPHWAPQRPVHPENSTEQAQEQGHLQKDEEQEVDTAQQGPEEDMVTMSSFPRGRSWCPALRPCPLHQVLCLQ
jgi:hypothetical protein